MQAQDIPLGLCQCGCGEKTKVSPKSAARYGYVKGKPRWFLLGHNRRADKPTLERYVVEDRGHDTSCWIWTGPVTNQGYGRCLAPKNGLRMRMAHRVFYEHYIEDIPVGLFIDHLCCVPTCVNPDHLDVVTSQENNRRSSSPSALNAQKTHCVHGHPFDWANTYWTPKGARSCRTCRAEVDRRRSASQAGK